MNASVIVRPEAEHDALSAYLYYEDQRTGLGAQFLAEVRGQIRRISERPLLYPRKHRSVRRSQFRRFPYVVAFTFNQRTRTIQILAIMHGARHPGRWQRRV